jgi:excisionase family DNA binding protein
MKIRCSKVHYATRMEKSMTANENKILTFKELQAYLKIPRSTLYKLCQEGRVPGQKVGKHWRFRKVTIDAWLDDQPLAELGTCRNK